MKKKIYFLKSWKISALVGVIQGDHFVFHAKWSCCATRTEWLCNCNPTPRLPKQHFYIWKTNIICHTFGYPCCHANLLSRLSFLCTKSTNQVCLHRTFPQQGSSKWGTSLETNIIVYISGVRLFINLYNRHLMFLKAFSLRFQIFIFLLWMLAVFL